MSLYTLKSATGNVPVTSKGDCVNYNLYCTAFAQTAGQLSEQVGATISSNVAVGVSSQDFRFYYCSSHRTVWPAFELTLDQASLELRDPPAPIS